jgi:phage-related protein
VRAAGAIQAEEFREYLEFTIPLKATNPLYIGSTLHTIAGGGTATNDGTTDAPMTIHIRGPVTNPAMQIGGFSLTWHGTVGQADELVIDTELRTVTFNGINARSGLTGAWPVLKPGDNSVTAPTTGSMTLSWRDRWV